MEDSILENNSLESSGGPKPDSIAALSYQTYGGSNFEDQNLSNKNPAFMVPSTAVKVDSATPSSANYDQNIHSTYLPSPSPSPYLPSSPSQSFSPELPSFIGSSVAPSSPSPTPTTQTVNDITENSLNKITNTLLSNDNFASSPPFTHSDITHGEADAVILDDDLPMDHFYDQSVAGSSGYGQAEVLSAEENNNNDYGLSSSAPAKPSKVTYIKPAFKPKPTKTAAVEPTTSKYVLVHTISNEKPPTPTNSDQSIDSIILMLNETKSGSEYSTSSATQSTIEHRETTTSAAQTRYPTTSSINYDKYGPTSFYITTKLPSPTKIPSKTAKPTASSPAISYTVSSSLDFQNSISPARPSATKVPTRTTPKPLVTSYISSTVIPKRPTTSSIKKGSTKKPVTKRPNSTTVKVTQSTANLVTKKQPPTKSPLVLASSTSQSVSPTQTYVSSTPTLILINPPKDSLRPQQPILSIVHEDTVQISGGAITDRPHPTVHITPKPVNNSVSSTVSYAPAPTRIGSPTYTPFVTKRPANVYTTPYIFEIPPGQQAPTQSTSGNYNGYYTPTTIVSTTSIYTNDQLDHHYYDQDVLHEKPTAVEGDVGGGGVSHNDDLSSFPPVRHPNLNMSAEVLDQKPLNTPVFIEDEKLNNKMNLLVSKIVASLQANFENLEDLVNEPNVTTPRPLNTRRPVQQVSAVTRRPTTTTARTPVRTTTRPRTTTTTKRPVRIATTTTTRRPATTRRPVTSAAPVTRKPSPKPTTRRPKPTRRVTTTTTTAETPVQEDEYVEEVSEDYEEEAPAGGEVDQGRIRKYKESFIEE